MSRLGLLAVLCGFVACASAATFFHESFHGTDQTCGSATVTKYITWGNDSCQGISQTQSFRFICGGSADSYQVKLWSFTASASCQGDMAETVYSNNFCLNAPGQGYIKLYCDDSSSATTEPTFASIMYSENQCSTAAETNVIEYPTGRCVPAMSGSTTSMFFCYANRTTQIVDYSGAQCSVDNCAGPFGNNYNKRTCFNFNFDAAAPPQAGSPVWVNPPAGGGAPQGITSPVASQPPSGGAPQGTTSPVASQPPSGGAPQAAPKGAPQPSGNMPQAASNQPVRAPANSSSSNIVSIVLSVMAISAALLF